MATIINGSVESNLASAKRALRRIRGAHFHRITTATDDVIAIVKGDEIIEKHIFTRPKPAASQRIEPLKPAPRRVFRVENLALYQ